MRNVKFSESGKPIIIGVVKEPTADAAISTIKTCEREGATAFDLHVSLLEGKERDPESLERIFRECDSPILAVHYNNLPKGIIIKNVVDGSPAEYAGLRAGDIIVKFGGIAVESTDAFAKEFSKYKPNDKVAIEIYRSGKYYTGNITIGSNNAA